MKRVDPNPLIARSLDVAEKRLGTAELCPRLFVPEATLRAWQLGHATMAEFKFLRLVDIITELDPTWIDWDEAQPK